MDTPLNAEVPRKQVLAERAAQLTPSALALALSAFAIGLSALPELRFTVGGLTIPPFLFILVLLIPVAIANVHRLPRRVLGALVLFTILFIVSMLPEGFAPSETLKLGSCVLILIACMALTRNERDFIAVCVGLSAALLLISLRGLYLGFTGAAIDPMGGINVLKGIGNKNAFSLYALPTLLLAGWAFTRTKARTLEKALFLASSVAMILAVFASANRSGWLGALVVILMNLVGRFSTRTLALALLIGFALYLLLGGEGETRAMVQRRIDQSSENTSDDVRVQLVIEGAQLGIENPLLGVSPQKLPWRLAQRAKLPIPAIDTHNVYVYVLGGSGVLATLAFLWLLFTFGFPYAGLRVPANLLVKEMMVLYAFRGAFTHEILFSPTFAFGVGLSIALVCIQRESQTSAQSVAKPGSFRRA